MTGRTMLETRSTYALMQTSFQSLGLASTDYRHGFRLGKTALKLRPFWNEDCQDSELTGCISLICLVKIRLLSLFPICLLFLNREGLLVAYLTP